jgi:AraC-like DNA-binding protein
LIDESQIRRDTCSISIATEVIVRNGLFLPTPADLHAYVWDYLEHHHDQRPRISEIASAFGTTSRGLRRQWQSTRRPSLRTLITIGCLSYAAWLIYDRHEKAVAAARMAGFRNYWNFNRGLKRHCQCTASSCRTQFPFDLDVPALFRTIETRHEDSPIVVSTSSTPVTLTRELHHVNVATSDPIRRVPDRTDTLARPQSRERQRR